MEAGSRVPIIPDVDGTSVAVSYHQVAAVARNSVEEGDVVDASVHLDRGSNLLGDEVDDVDETVGPEEGDGPTVRREAEFVQFLFAWQIG